MSSGRAVGPITPRTYSRAASGGSDTPCANGLFGIQIPPPDTAVVPPKCTAFSSTITFKPACAARTAAVSPEAPDPTTMTSHSIGPALLQIHRHAFDLLYQPAAPILRQVAREAVRHMLRSASCKRVCNQTLRGGMSRIRAPDRR